MNNKNSISCAACFNQIAYQSENVKHFPSLVTTDSMINTFKDHLETYSASEVLQIINGTFKSDKMNEQGLGLLGIDFQANHLKNYVAVKCENCFTTLGIYNSTENNYLIFNSI